MGARKHELRAVEALLHEPAEDSVELAESIIATLDETRASRVDWAVVVFNKHTARSYGPWPGRKSAQQAVDRGRVPILSGERSVVVPLIGLARLAAQWAKTDEAPPQSGKVETVSRRPTVSDTHVKNVESIHVLDKGENWKRVV